MRTRNPPIRIRSISPKSARRLIVRLALGSSEPEPDSFRSLYERRSERVELDADVALRRSGHATYRVRVHDVSPHGCKLEFVERPQVDELVWVKFQGLDAIESAVCRVDGFVVGVEFVQAIHPAVFEALVARLG